MAMLDLSDPYLSGGLKGLPIGEGYANLEEMHPEMAQAAREAAAMRQKRKVMRPTIFDEDMVQPDQQMLGMLNAGAPPAPLAQSAAPGMISGAQAAPAQTGPPGVDPLDVPRPVQTVPAPSTPMGLLSGGVSPPPPVAPPPANVSPPPPQAVERHPSVPQTSVLGRIGDMINDRSSTLLALGAGMAGAQNIGQGLSRGFAAAIPALQQDQKLSDRNATVKALLGRGVPPDIAHAATTNPAILQQLIPSLFGPKQLKYTTINDSMGNPKPYFVDEVNGTIHPANLPGMSGGGPENAGGNNVHGEDFLKTLTPMEANEVKAFSEGRAPVTSRNLQKMLPLVTQYDPTFNAQDYNARSKLLTSIKSGADAKTIDAFNTLGGHLVHLSDVAEGLNNSDFQVWNTVKNFALSNTGDPRVEKFNLAKHAVVNELSKAYRGGQVSDSDAKGWAEAINSSKSPEQLRSVIGDMATMVNSKITAVFDRYHENMGPLAPKVHELSPQMKYAIEELPKQINTIKQRELRGPSSSLSEPPSRGPAYTPPAGGWKPGVTYEFRDGKFVEKQP